MKVKLSDNDDDSNPMTRKEDIEDEINSDNAPTQFRSVLIEEFYRKTDGVVYRCWRYAGGRWNVVETPFPDIPWVTFKTEIDGSIWDK